MEKAFKILKESEYYKQLQEHDKCFKKAKKPNNHILYQDNPMNKTKHSSKDMINMINPKECIESSIIKNCINATQEEALNKIKKGENMYNFISKSEKSPTTYTFFALGAQVVNLTPFFLFSET